MRILRLIFAKIYKVPFRDRVWYNFQAHLRKDEYDKYSHIQIWDSNGKYIVCPGCGGIVEYVVKGVHYKYRIVGFKNKHRDSDWLYDSDYIYPIIEFLEIIK